MNENYPFSEPSRNELKKTELEQRGTQLDTGAPVTGAVAVGDAVAASFGDGTVRLFRPDLDPAITNVHLGVVLCMATDHDHLLTGGADGRFLRISPNGDVEELGNFGTKCFLMSVIRISPRCAFPIGLCLIALMRRRILRTRTAVDLPTLVAISGCIG